MDAISPGRKAQAGSVISCNARFGARGTDPSKALLQLTSIGEIEILPNPHDQLHEGLASQVETLRSYEELTTPANSSCAASSSSIGTHSSDSGTLPMILIRVWVEF